jgi:hypothetical protein
VCNRYRLSVLLSRVVNIVTAVPAHLFELLLASQVLQLQRPATRTASCHMQPRMQPCLWHQPHSVARSLAPAALAVVRVVCGTVLSPRIAILSRA